METLQIMSAFFWGPEPEQCNNMLRESFWLPIERVIPWLEPPSPAVFNEIKMLVNHFTDADPLFHYLEEVYIRLFISDPKGLRTPLYASCYAGEESGKIAPLMGEPALAMKERFRSKGLSLADTIHDPPDHLAIELEFLYFLLEKGWAERDNLLLEEAFSFSSEIMLPWVIKLQERLVADEIENRFYPLITALLCAILRLVGRLNKTL